MECFLPNISNNFMKKQVALPPRILMPEYLIEASGWLLRFGHLQRSRMPPSAPLRTDRGVHPIGLPVSLDSRDLSKRARP
jgi:hypothetical protein